MKKWLCLLFILTGCSLFPDFEPPCVTGQCQLAITSKFNKDSNGYYHVGLGTSSYTYFSIYAEASKLKDKYKYNGISVIEGNFDSNAYWTIGDTLAFVVPLYASFGGLKNSPYWNAIKLPVENRVVYLSQFEGMLVPLVQTTKTYFQEYKEPEMISNYHSDYEPSDKIKFDWTKRVIGPIPHYMKGDTITIYAKTFWEAGEESLEKKTSAKFILE